MTVPLIAAPSPDFIGAAAALKVAGQGGSPAFRLPAAGIGFLTRPGPDPTVRRERGSSMRRLIPVALWIWVGAALAAYLFQFRTIFGQILKAGGLL